MRRMRRQPGTGRRGWDARRIACWLTALLAVVVLSPSELRAEGSSSFDKGELEEETLAHYERAMRAFKSEDYETAARELRTVYSLRPAPIILYNIALAEWRAGDIDAAILAAVRASDDDLPPRAAAKNAGRLAGFRRIARARSASAAVGERAEAPAEPQTSSETEAETASPPPDATGRRPNRTLGWIGAGIGGIGVGALVGALYVDRQLAARVDPYEQAAREGDLDAFERYRREELRDAKRLQGVGRILFWSGVALTAAGGSLVILDATSVSVSPERAGLSARISVRF